MTTRTTVLIALAAAAPACASLDDLDVSTSVAASSTDCEEIVCGNAAALDDHPFWELDQSKVAYSPVGGFRIKSFRTAGDVPLVLRVQGFVLLGINGVQIIGPMGLIGAKLVIESRIGPQYEMTLEAVGSIPYLELGNVDPPIPTYRWRYRRIGATNDAPDTFLCRSDDIHYGEKDAVMFAGDRYSKATGTVIATGREAEPWFNIACNDAALWKMAVFRFVEAARRLPRFDTDVADRTAAIRAIRADYCGNNVAWTESGTAVDWANRRAWLTINAVAYPNVEAIWDENGAICLSKPRKTPIGMITCWDPSKVCDGLVGSWTARGRMITFVP